VLASSASEATALWRYRSFIIIIIIIIRVNGQSCVIDHPFFNDILKTDKLIFDWRPLMFTYWTISILTASGSHETIDQSASRLTDDVTTSANEEQLK